MAESGQVLKWQLQLQAPIEAVFELLVTDAGRERFWVEESRQRGEALDFRFSGGETLRCPVLEVCPPTRFRLGYFEGSELCFELTDTNPGTHLQLTESGLSGPDHYAENRAGWVSVLMALKARADFGVDLRNHDPRRSWAQGYPDN